MGRIREAMIQRAQAGVSNGAENGNGNGTPAGVRAQLTLHDANGHVAVTPADMAAYMEAVRAAAADHRLPGVTPEIAEAHILDAMMSPLARSFVDQMEAHAGPFLTEADLNNPRVQRAMKIQRMVAQREADAAGRPAPHIGIRGQARRVGSFLGRAVEFLFVPEGWSDPKGLNTR